VLPDEVKKLAGEESQFVSLDYYAPGERSPARLVIRIEELDELAHNGGMADVLRSAIGVRHSASGAEDGHAQNEAGNGGSGSTTQALSMQVSPPGSDN
jgi:hypothetical protein